MDDKSLNDLSIKRTRVDRHHELLKGSGIDNNTLWVPQPFQRAKVLDTVLYKDQRKAYMPEDKYLRGPVCKEVVRVKPLSGGGDQKSLKFFTNDDGTLNVAEVANSIKGITAFKYQVGGGPEGGSTWRVITIQGDRFPRPPDGWQKREYIPVVKQENAGKSAGKYWDFDLFF